MAAITSEYLKSQSFQLTYFVGGFIFLLLGLIDRRKAKKTKLVRCTDGEDFSLMSVSFRGVRTSLAYFELAMMSGIAVLNLSFFLAAVDLKKPEPNYNLAQSTNPDPSIAPLFKSKQSSDFNCTIGLLMGFLLVAFISLIKFKKLYLSYLAKLVLVIHSLNFVFFSKSYR